MRVIECGFKDRQYSVRSRAAPADAFRARVGFSVLLCLASLRPQSRGCLGDLLVPNLNAHPGQLVERHGAKLGLDPRADRSLNAVRRFAAATLVVGEVFSDSIGDGVSAVERHEASCLLP